MIIYRDSIPHVLHKSDVYTARQLDTDLQPMLGREHDYIRIRPDNWRKRNHGPVCPELIAALEAGIREREGRNGTPRASRNGHVSHTAPALRREARPKRREGETRS
jgi:hypothetical protein